jgi:hypothetical protein
MPRPLGEELITLLRDAEARQAACKGHAFGTVATIGALDAQMCWCGASRVWNTATAMEATKEDIEAERWREEMRRSLDFVLLPARTNDKKPTSLS